MGDSLRRSEAFASLRMIVTCVWLWSGPGRTFLIRVFLDILNLFSVSSPDKDRIIWIILYQHISLASLQKVRSAMVRKTTSLYILLGSLDPYLEWCSPPGDISVPGTRLEERKKEKVDHQGQGVDQRVNKRVDQAVDNGYYWNASSKCFGQILKYMIHEVS